ncbi:OmpP1/FadL family transporter [Georgfuchsia toluolica]|nr:outer membrane protein transport protein [Georgfuchsia toluolica]
MKFSFLISSRILVTMLLSFLFFPTVTHATNGYLSNGYGMKSQGLAGVGVALPQDALAAGNNPAGTALVGDRIDFGLSWFMPERGTTITGSSVPGASGSYDGNYKKSFFIPEFGYTKQLSNATSIGVAVFGNGGLNIDYPRNPFAAYGSKGSASTDFVQLSLSPSVAWKPSEQHALGAAVNFIYQRFTANGLSAFDNPGTSAYPGSVTNRGADSSTGWGLRLGWIGQITPALSLGATWVSKVSATKFDKYKGLLADAGSFDVPENYGIGIAYKITPALTLVADVQEIRYSGVRSLANPLSNLTVQGNLLGSPNGGGFGWKDITVVKFGASYEYSKNLTLRGGYSCKGNPIPSDQNFFNIAAPAVVKDHLTFGSTWKTSSGAELSVAYVHAPKNTTNGRGSIPAALGGGDVKSFLEEDILGVAYGWKL